MNGPLTYRDARSRGLDLIKDPIELFFGALGFAWDLIGPETAIELLLAFLECL